MHKQIYDFFDDKIKFKIFIIKKFSLIIKKKNYTRKECIALPINAILKIISKNDN
jgi:hypothetical protein